MDSPHKKSLREVLPKKTSTTRRPRTKTESASEDNNSRPTESTSNPNSFRPDSYRMRGFDNRSSSKKSKLIASVLGGALIVFVAGTVLFQHATVNVKTRTEEVTLNTAQTITALANSGNNSASTSTTSDATVYFGLIQKTVSATTSAASSGTKKITTKATGQITIYNNFSSTAQPLVAGTRFSTSDGKIYKLDKAVTVPGLKGGNPGTVTANVTADTAGDKYNISPTAFTIPGFKGTPKYSKIYGRSSSSMTGGFTGEQPVITIDDKTKADKTLKQSLTDEISKLTNNQIPPGYILLDGAQIINYSDSKQISGGNSGTTILTQSATVTLVLLDRSSLGQYLVKGAITDYQGEPVDIKNADDLKLTINTKENPDLDNTQKLSLTLKGKSTLIWILDQEGLKKALAGLTEKSYPAALAKFPAISKSSVVFRPPWFRYIPKNIDRITVVTDTNQS